VKSTLRAGKTLHKKIKDEIKELVSPVMFFLASGYSTQSLFPFTQSNNDNVLVIDPVSFTVSLIASTQTGNTKWNGIAAAGDGKFYCAPSANDNVLVIDPATIDSTTTGSSKWNGIAAAADGKLYAAPMNTGNVLIVDGNMNIVSLLDSTAAGTLEWTSNGTSQNASCAGGPMAGTRSANTMYSSCDAKISGESCQPTCAAGYSSASASTFILLCDSVTQQYDASAVHCVQGTNPTTEFQ